MGEIHSLLKSRKSCRKFLAKSVSIQDIYTILEGARWAPSGKNGQPWRFVVVKEKKQKIKLLVVLYIENGCKKQMFLL